LVAAKEISDHQGDAGDMNMQLVLAAASRRINCHSDLVTQQSVPRPFLNEAAGRPMRPPNSLAHFRCATPGFQYQKYEWLERRLHAYCSKVLGARQSLDQDRWRY
jgi:hypothetical protein